MNIVICERESAKKRSNNKNAITFFGNTSKYAFIFITALVHFIFIFIFVCVVVNLLKFGSFSALTSRSSVCISWQEWSESA